MSQEIYSKNVSYSNVNRSLAAASYGVS